MRRRLVVAAIICVVLAIFVFVTYPFWLGLAGAALVSGGNPEKADVALVLAGDFRGMRIVRAAELVKSGYVPKVLVSGPTAWYGLNEADLAIQFAASKGYPREWFEPMRFPALSTVEEARAFAPELRRRGVRKLLIVTSNFHTRRAGKIFRRELSPSIEVKMIGAQDKYFDPGSWWHTREGWKTFFYEASKTIAGAVGV